MASEYDIAVEGRAYLLRPDTPLEGIPRQPSPEGSDNLLSEPLKSQAESAGLVMRRAPKTSYTLYALEATEHAQQLGLFDPFHRAAYKAYWEHGKDLGDMDVIRDLALQCSMDWDDLSGKLESGYYRETVLSQYREAMDLGIRGIPAFIVGNQLFTGAQPYEIFKLAVARARETMGG